MSKSQQIAEPEAARTSQLISRRQWLQTALAASLATALASPLASAHAETAGDSAPADASPVAPAEPAVFGATLALSALGGADIELRYWRQDFQGFLLAAGPLNGKAITGGGDSPPFRITKLVDSATPGLQKIAQQGTVSKKAQLTVTRNGAPWMRADLVDVTLVATKLGGSVDEAPTETLTFAFAQANWHQNHGNHFGQYEV